jgi:localization factor PodJL
MTAAGPWSVKGIDPKAREMAKDLARRSGMTLGEWLNQMIIDGGDGDVVPPPPFESADEAHGRRYTAARRALDRPELRDGGRGRLLDQMYREATGAQGGQAERRYEASSRRIPEYGYQERGFKDAAPPAAARTDVGLADVGRADVGHTDSASSLRGDAFELTRITRVLETLSSRLEMAEHRSTLAISGIDQSVMGVLSRLDGLDEAQGQTATRLESAIDQVRDTQARVAERVRNLEQEDGSRVDALRALEGALSRLAGQINESGAKADGATAGVREELGSLGRRVNTIETEAEAAASTLAGVERTRQELETVERRIDAVEDAVAQAPQAYADAEKVETVLARLAERLERAEARTTTAVRSLESSFAGLDARLRTNEARAHEPDVAGEIDRRFQGLAADLSRKVDASRAEFAERLRGAADAAKLSGLETSLRDMAGHVAQSEQRAAQAIDRMAREVATIAQSLGERVAGAESRSTAAVDHMGSEMTRISDAIDNRLKRADAAQAEALERLGGEIARIAERLTERLAASDKRSAEALDATAGRFARLTETISDRQDRTSSELTDRIRQSEERTAKLLNDTREKLEQRTQDLQRASAREAALRAPQTASPPPHDAATPILEPPSIATQTLDSERGADPFAPMAAVAPARAPVHDDPFAALRAAFAPASETPSRVQTSLVDESAVGGTWRTDSLSDADADPFDPDDDFEASPSGAPKFRPPPPAFDSFAAPQAQPHTLHAPPEEEPFDQVSVGDFVGASPTDRANSTRDMLDQARAAAKRAAGGRDGSKPNAIPAPAFDGGETKTFGLSFNSKAKKGDSSTLRTVGLASVWACAITSAAVGAYSLAMKDSGGQSHGQVAEAPTAAAAPTEQADANAGKPQLAMALTPPPSAAGAAGPDAPASAGPVSKTAAELAPGPKAAPATAVVAHKAPAPAVSRGAAPPLSAIANPAAGPETAANALETARSLYDDSVRRIEAGDSAAVKDLKRAANLGFAPAQFYLGRLYEAGAAGLSKDMGEARRWTQRAAQGGDPAAMYNLASYLYAGDGGPKDQTGAVEWFRKAAERGVVNGQFNLAQLYETGHGVKQNLAEAYKWYLVAAAANDPEAKANVETLKTKLPADARAAAERSAATLHSQLEGSTHVADARPEGTAPR